LIFEGYKEIKNKISSGKYTKGDESERWFIKLADFFAVVVGAVVTFYLNNHVGLGAVVAAGIVGILGYVVAPKYEVPIYCGSFVGMSSASVYDLEHLLIASVLAGIIFVITKRIFKGVGGKLGTVALIGGVLTAVITGREFTKSSLPGRVSRAFDNYFCCNWNLGNLHIECEVWKESCFEFGNSRTHRRTCLT